jgi:hypothetical protein
MIDKETLRKLCEYEYSVSLVGEAILDFEVDFVVKETAEQRAHRIWGMTSERDRRDL